MDTDNVNCESYDNTDQDDGEEEDLGAVHRDSLCNRCGGKGHFARNCGTPDPRGKGKGKGKGKDGKGGSQQQAKGSSRDPIICQYCNKKGHTAKECWKKEREENRDRSANYVDQDACNVDCMGFDMASLEVEKAVAPGTQGWQMVKLCASCSSRVRDVPSCNHPRDQQRSNRYSPLMTSFGPPGLCHPIKEKDEDGDIVVGETMEVNVVDVKKNFGKITIDSGAAENVLPREYLPVVLLQPSPGSQRGACFIAANGTRMENLGQKRVDFEAANGVKSNILFQVTDSRKPLASVSKIVAKGNRVVFAPDRSYIENVSSGRKIDMQLTNGTYAIDVEFLATGPFCQAAVARTEIDKHNMTHLPFRSWCRHCVRGRAESHPHLRQRPKELVIPELHADYCFLGKADEKTVPITVLRDRATQVTCSMIVKEKGIGDGYVVRRVIAFIRELGCDGKKSVLKSDQESSVNAVLVRVAQVIWIERHY